MVQLCYSLDEAARQLETNPAVVRRLARYFHLPEPTSRDAALEMMRIRRHPLPPFTEHDIQALRAIMTRLAEGESLADIRAERLAQPVPESLPATAEPAPAPAPAQTAKLQPSEPNDAPEPPPQPQPGKKAPPALPWQSPASHLPRRFGFDPHTLPRQARVKAPAPDTLPDLSRKVLCAQAAKTQRLDPAIIQRLSTASRPNVASVLSKLLEQVCAPAPGSPISPALSPLVAPAPVTADATVASALDNLDNMGFSFGSSALSGSRLAPEIRQSARQLREQALHHKPQPVF